MISVIIPTYNEETQIGNTLKTLRLHDPQELIKELIVVDGGSHDETIAIANAHGAKVVTGKKGRAAQMNFGAAIASQSVLYFIHADTIPPYDFTNEITKAIGRGYGAGCYRLSFDYNHWFLRVNCWFTRFNIDAIRFGDQSLFVRKTDFMKTQGFCEQHIVMEDQHMIKQLKKHVRFTIIKKPVLTSSRKYLENGIYKTQAVFFIIFFMYQAGVSQQKLVSFYQKMIKQDKL